LLFIAVAFGLALELDRMCRAGWCCPVLLLLLELKMAEVFCTLVVLRFVGLVRLRVVRSEKATMWSACVDAGINIAERDGDN
jgi:hypothetical protein